MNKYDPTFSSMIGLEALPLVIPEIFQNTESGDCGLYMLLYAEKLISHYGSFDLDGPITYNLEETNKIFSFFQFSAEAVDELRSEILRVIKILTDESEKTLSEKEDGSKIEVLDSAN